VPISVESVTLPVIIGVMSALLQMSTVLLKNNTNLRGQKEMQRKIMSEPNLFVTSLPTTRNMHRQGPRIKGKRKPMKSKPVIRVGGRKVSAALKNNTRYAFPVEVSHIGDTNQ